jgi:hypothetical protein
MVPFLQVCLCAGLILLPLSVITALVDRAAGVSHA